jgi:hypothetical protein
MVGYVCLIAGGPVAWKAKKMKETALSSTQTEFIALFEGIKEVMWLRGLLEELGEKQQQPTPLFCDSQGAIGLAMDATHHGPNKHMQLKYLWVKDQVQEEEHVKLQWVGTKEQVADILTKRLDEASHWTLIHTAGMTQGIKGGDQG